MQGADTYEVYRDVKDYSGRISTSINNSRYLDQSTKEGTNYQYWVRGCNNFGCSDYSQGVEIRVASPPPQLQIRKVYTTVELSWLPVQGADTYKVYRDKKEDSGRISTVIGNNYLDKSTKEGTSYQYWVKACNSFDDCSDFSAAIDILTIPAVPQFHFLNPKRSAGIALYWSAVQGAETYQIYKKIGHLLTVNLLRVPLASSTTSYTDRSVKFSTRDK